MRCWPKQLGFDVKVAGSSIALDQAAVLMDYALTGTLPPDFKKPGEKASKPSAKPKGGITTQPKPKTRENTAAKREEENTAPETSVRPEPAGESAAAPAETGTPAENKTSPAEETSEEAPKKRPLRRPIGRGGITIVKKAKTAKKPRNISLADTPQPVARKKKSKRPVEAKEAGQKLELLGDRDLGASFELYEEEEVVLLDFSDKNIYEEMKRQEERRRAEAKKREQQQGNMSAGARRFQPQQRRSIRRGGKKKRYTRHETEEKVSVVKIPEDVRVYEFAEKVGKSVGEVVKVLFALGTMVTKRTISLIRMPSRSLPTSSMCRSRRSIRLMRSIMWPHTTRYRMSIPSPVLRSSPSWDT